MSNTKQNSKMTAPQGGQSANHCYAEFIVEGEYPTWNQWLQHGEKCKTLKQAQILMIKLDGICDRKFRIKKQTLVTEIL